MKDETLITYRNVNSDAWGEKNLDEQIFSSRIYHQLECIPATEKKTEWKISSIENVVRNRDMEQNWKGENKLLPLNNVFKSDRYTI